MVVLEGGELVASGERQRTVKSWIRILRGPNTPFIETRTNRTVEPEGLGVELFLRRKDRGMAEERRHLWMEGKGYGEKKMRGGRR